MIGQLDLTNLTKEEQRYRANVEDDTNDHGSWFMLAQVYQRKRQLDKAIESYEKAIDLENKPDYHLKLGELLFDQAMYSSSLSHLLVASKMTDDTWEHQEELSELISRIYEYDSC